MCCCVNANFLCTVDRKRNKIFVGTDMHHILCQKSKTRDQNKKCDRKRKREKSKLGTGREKMGLSWSSGFLFGRTFESFMCAD